MKKYDEGPNNVVMKILKANPIKRCLFGVPNIVDTEKMLQEQLKKDRLRFMEKFDFDLKEIERLDMDGNNENVNINSSGNQSSGPRKMKKLFRERRTAVFRPYNRGNNNQSVMTGEFPFNNISLQNLFPFYCYESNQDRVISIFSYFLIFHKVNRFQ